MWSPSRRSIVLLIALAAVLYLVGNARVSLWDRDEPRYAQTSRQMLESGDWVVPRYLDKVRTAKPVFIYWCQTAAMSALGRDGDAGAFAARLPSAIAMAIVLALVAVITYRSFGPAHSFWATLVLATSALVVWSAKACTTDAVLLAGITVAQLCLYYLWRGRATWPVVIALAIAIGIAGLTKGPVVLGVMGMTLVALGAFRVVDRRRRLSPAPGTPGKASGTSDCPRAGGGAGLLPEVKSPARNPNPESEEDPHPIPLLDYRQRERRIAVFGALLRIVVAIAIVTPLVAPWLYLVAKREAGFLGTSVSHDVFTRIVKPLEGHSGPPGYHLAFIFATFLPWSILLPMAIVSGWQHRADPRLRFALAAVLGPWVMFELVRTKLPHYMLPVFPPLALLTADAIVRCLRGEKDDLRRRPFKVAAVVLGLVIIALGVGALITASRLDNDPAPGVALVLTALVFAAVVIVMFAKRRWTAGLLSMGFGMAAVYAVLFAVYLPRADYLRVSQRVAAMLHEEGATGPGQVEMLDYKEPSLAFYQGGSIREESAMTLSHELLDGGPQWFVITDDVWKRTPADVRARLEEVGSVTGLAYADGWRGVNVMVVRRR